MANAAGRNFVVKKNTTTIASVRTKTIVPQVDAQWVRVRADRVALAALCAVWVGEAGTATISAPNR